jgi:hypothetical protein
MTSSTDILEWTQYDHIQLAEPLLALASVIPSHIFLPSSGFMPVIPYTICFNISYSSS